MGKIPTGALSLALVCLLSPGSLAGSDEQSFVLDLQRATSPEEGRLRQLLEESDLGDVIADLNDELELDEPVKIRFWSAEPGKPPAEYDGDLRRISISYSFVAEVDELFGGSYPDWYASVEQVVLHEIGHALIHASGMEEASRAAEEIAADQLAFFVITEFYETTEDLHSVAKHFRKRGFLDRGGENLHAKSGSHLPNRERAKLYECWIDGRIDYLFNEESYCVTAYEDLWDEWDERLEPLLAPEDPEEVFLSLLEEGLGLDAARQEVESEFDAAVAAEIAIYHCSPPVPTECYGSTVLDAWTAFVASIDEGATASGAASDVQLDFDDYLADGLAVFWCSPEPLAGCEEDPIADAWAEFESLVAENPNPAAAIAAISPPPGHPFVAEMIAASVCGEATCYQDEFADWEASQFEQILAPGGQAQSRHRYGLRFAFDPGAPPKKPKKDSCKTNFDKRVLDRCKAPTSS